MATGSSKSFREFIQIKIMNIAFIDHDIDNWHANTFARLLSEEHPELKLTAVYANRKDNLQSWAAERNVAVVDSIEALRPLADAIMVLAPSNPETHLELCREAFRLGKPTYVDKTFAPDAQTAKLIFDEADARGVSIQTSSVLRYTEVQEYCATKSNDPVRYIATWAGGGNFEEYLIHPVEHVISVLGPDYRDIRCREVAGFRKIEISFANGSEALINMHINHAVAFFSVISLASETQPIMIDGNKIFASGLSGILNFFKNPSQAIDRRETMAIMEILEKIKTQYAS